MVFFVVEIAEIVEIFEIVDKNGWRPKIEYGCIERYR